MKYKSVIATRRGGPDVLQVSENDLRPPVAGEVRVKVATRPSGECTAKAEIDDLARAAGDRSGRERLRRHVESRALDRTGNDERSAATDD